MTQFDNCAACDGDLIREEEPNFGVSKGYRHAGVVFWPHRPMPKKYDWTEEQVADARWELRR